MAGDKGDTSSIKQKVLCLRCRHYFVTWDKNRPYGCRAFKLKPSVFPCYDVQFVSNMNSLKYEARPEKR